MTAISTAILIIFAVMGIIYCVREITYFLIKQNNLSQSLLLLPTSKDEIHTDLVQR